MKEIGGYLEFEIRFQGKEYHENAVGLNLARNALLYLLETKKYKKIYLPYFLCDCISGLLKQAEVKMEYYHVNIQGKPIFEKRLGANEAIWIVNYYGQLTAEEMILYKQKWEAVILDNTHDFFSKPIPGIDTIYNARKYFGVADGGYLYTDKPLERELDHGYSYERMKHIVGRFEKTANEFYEDFQLSEQLLDQEGLKKMSPFTRNILKGVDYQKVKRIRQNNFSFLNGRLKKYNQWTLQELPGTYMYPFWCKDGAKVRKKMAEESIYIPTLWPNVLDAMPEDTLEYQLAENVLPLPIDQRYTEKDMAYMCDKILECI